MPTDEHTLDMLESLKNKLESLGVKSKELTSLKQHIARQRKQIAWGIDKKYHSKATS